MAGLVTLSGALLAEGLLVAPAAVFAVSSPVARWTLDDGSGTSANDEVGTADGTVVGNPTWLTSGAAVGTGAIRLDGVNDEIVVPASSAIEPAEALLTAWVRADPNDQPDAGEVILEKGAFDCDGPSFGIYVADGGLRFSFRTPDGEQVGRVTDDFGAVDLWDGAWHLISLSLHKQRGTVPSYAVGILSMDGFPYGSGAVGAPMAAAQAIAYTGATHGELVIGGPVDDGCGGSNFDGDVDDVRVYADPFFLAGSLMPPIPVTVSDLQAGTGHPGGSFTTSVDLSPVPRWGGVAWEVFRDGAWHFAGSASALGDADGVIEATLAAPVAVGSYPLRATYSTQNQPPYVGSSATSTLEVTPWPTTTTVWVDSDPKLPYANVFLTATVASTPAPSSPIPVGSVKFYDTTPATPVLLGTASLGPATGTGSASAGLWVNTLGAGTHAIVAEFVGPDPVRAGSESEPFDVVIGKQTPYLALSGPEGTVDANNAFTLKAVIEAGTSFAHDATMTFRRVGSSTPICTKAVAGPETSCVVPGLPIGSPQFTVAYSGNSDTEAKTSDPLTVQVVADTLRSSGVGVQYTTFYPVKDTYRDTVALRGTRNEPISVTIKIYKPSGSLLKTVSVASGSGPYAYAWTGRTSTGTILAEGKYKVVQTLKDATNHTLTVTSYVTLSKKKLYWHSKTISQLGSSVDARGQIGGTISINTTSGFAKLYAAPESGSWAAAGWEFTLPSAAVYDYFYVRIQGRHTGGPGTNRLGAQQFTRSGCGYSSTADWKEVCFGQWATIPGTSGTTLYYYKTAKLSSDYRTSARKVRLLVMTTGGTIWVYKAQVVVRYATLAY